jgi:hypothetical protein
MEVIAVEYLYGVFGLYPCAQLGCTSMLEEVYLEATLKLVFLIENCQKHNNLKSTHN